ncbi:YhgE/Pip domain-containing protein [Bacillus sp. B190/17]|uniref:YhgE/Pip domain-containing protein n=1 Tax=Bacillus lumedeiriae TaxID=3058829 RepID=A0ABW8I6K7_9BACI
MRKVFQIYKTDWRRIFSVSTGIMLAAAVMFLPAIYAWVNIKAMWDPYEDTSGIKVAVTNLDQGAAARGEELNIGKELVNHLNTNKKLGWTFVSQEEAERGVKHGEYYAGLLIPADFSKKMTSILSKNPEQAEIDYMVNEKLNAVAPKITEKGAAGVVEKVSSHFTKAVDKAVLTAFNEAGIELEKELPSIRNIESKILELEKRLPHLKEMGTTVLVLEEKLPKIKEKSQKIVELEKQLPKINGAGNDILKVEERMSQLKEVGNDVLFIQNKLPAVQLAAEKAAEVDRNFDKAAKALEEGIEGAQRASDMITAAQQEFSKEGKEKLPDVKSALLNAQEGVQFGLQELEAEKKEFPRIQADIHEAVLNIEEKMDTFTTVVNKAAFFVQNDLPSAEQKVHQAADFVRSDLPAVEQDIKQASYFIQEKLPAVEDAVHQAAHLVRSDLPELEKSIRQAADKIRKFEAERDLEDLVKRLKHDVQKESDFLANPIKLKEEKVFPIPNYGSAMSPFYTTLSLWVGATLLISLFRTDVEDPDNSYKSYHVYFGKLLTFLTIGVFQAIIVSIGDIFLLHAYVAEKFWFVVFAVLISIVFVTVTYTLVSVFGNIGKGVAIILLVLQFSSSGGTFPVSLTPPLFQQISPFVPFTYAVSLLREAVGGIVSDIVEKDLLALLFFFIITILFALLLKKPLSGITNKLAENAKKTKVFS